MNASGINYFYSNLGLNTGVFTIMYPFNDGAGTNVASVSGAQSGYSGTLSSAVGFWDAPGSGHFNGTILTVNNTSGAHSETWTKIFTYEKVNVDDCTLFNSLNGTSGHKIGLTRANKLYFESFNQEPITASFVNNLSSKNAISVSYLTNQVTFGLYNFNSQTLESQSFTYPFQVTRSDNWTLGGQFTGYMDLFVHLTQIQSAEVIGQLMSGLYSIPTGIGYDVSLACVTGVTGYQNVFVGETGVTGYITTPGGDEGRDYYTGAFPTFHTTSALTGYLSSGLYSSGLSGVVCYPVTGGSTVLFSVLSGYASSFGMQKVQLYTPLISTDLVKSSWSQVANDIYNKNGQPSYGSFLMKDQYPTGLVNLYYNGVGQANSGWVVSGLFLTISGTSAGDVATFDLKSGDKRSFVVAGGNTGFSFSPFSGQEIYLNGINLISGYDYVLNGSTLNLTNRATGVNGDIFEYPIVLTPRTGNASMMTGLPFWRNTSNEYLNGVRQQEYFLYTEGALYDLLSGNQFTYSGVVPIYDGSQLFWES